MFCVNTLFGALGSLVNVHVNVKHKVLTADVVDF